MRPLLFRCLIALAVLLAGCGSLGANPANGRLPVVATFSVVADLVRQVGGDHVALNTLVGPGIDTHTFNPTPADAAALADAQLIIENGAGFESWLDELYVSTGSHATRVALAEGVSLLETGGQPDPHIWLNVANAVIMVGNVRAALVAADPAHRSDYEANAADYTARLQALDAWVSQATQALPADRRKLVTTHDTLAYFAERYDFQVLGSVLPATTEGASPSAQALAGLVEAVRAAGVPAVFAENVSSNSLVNQVAAEAGVQVVASLYTDALGPEGSGAETYMDMMRQNVNTIVSALGS
jgi:ABC-type Zn uptake system ZnuABC Zn-binding protein ZnuA